MTMKRTFFTFFFLLAMANVYAYDIAVENANGVTIYYNYINDGQEDVSCSISYKGKITEDDGSVFVSADVEFGADVTSTLVALVPGNLTDEVKAAIIAGEYANIVEISENGQVKFPATDMYDGTYTFVVVTFLNGQAKNIATDTFKYVVVNPVWKSLGWCKYTEDCLGPIYRFDDDDPLNYVCTYEVEIQEDENHPGLYRLVNPYGEVYPFNDPGDWDASHDYYMEINACDPEGVFIGAQEMGLNWGHGEFTICSLGAYNLEKGTTFDEVKASGVMGNLENGIITFPKNGLLAKIGDRGWYYGNTTASFKIVLPDTTHQEEPTYYRHFIEEGKVWKVGDVVYANTAHEIKYCYFEGDTVISGRKCTMMWCRHEKQNHQPSTMFMGALYENAGRVYLVLEGTRDFKLIYDFASKEGHYFELYDHADQIDFDIIQATIKKRFTLINDHYKGPCYTVILKKPWGDTIFQDVEETWMGGVGSQYLPLDNCALHYGDNNMLMSCTAGDEVLYYNRNIIDGVTPDPSEVKKNTIDFTHVVKTRPKAPRRGVVNETGDDEPLTGEYSMKELFVNFKPLAGHYVITICNESGTEVYRKEVQTSNVVGLNTDISGYEKGEYTITVENNEEAYTAEFKIDEETGIKRPTPDPSRDGGEKAGAWYDLSGRRVTSSLHKGIYIRGGRKVVVK
jgi:hypothetical protein